jgi:hypothetical protein
MARFSDITTNFSGGLITDYVSARTDLAAVKNSCRKFNNFLPILQGPARYRAGFKWITGTSIAGEKAVSASITLATNQSYLTVFSERLVRIYDPNGSLLDSVTTPYIESELGDLRFASETDVLYIVHGSHRPRKLSVGVTIVKAQLRTTETDLSNRPLYTTEADTSNLALKGDTEAFLDSNWSLSVIDFDVEPFLEPDTSDTKLSISRNTHYVKLTSTASTFQAIVDAGDGSWENYYVEYSLDGEKLLGRVRDAAHNALLADPTPTVVYIEPVDSVVDIQDDDARLFLLDAEETSDVEDLEKLKLDGVEDNKIEVRSDTLVFSKNLEDSWLRVGDDRRDDSVVVGEDRTTTRWVKIKEYRGTENHPVEFHRGTTAFENSEFEDGSIYKVYSNEYTNTSFKEVPNNATGSGILYRKAFSLTSNSTNGHFNVVQSQIKFYPTLLHDNRIFTFRGLLAKALQNTDVDTADLLTGRSDSVVGNLTNSREQDVVECYNNTDDGVLKVESGNNLIVASNVNLVVEDVINTLDITATASIFSDVRDAGRFVYIELPSGYVTLQITSNVADITSTTAVADLKSSIPFKKGTKNVENDGQALSFQLGAWYTGNYPRAVARYERRVVYGGTYNYPNYLFFSRVDNEFDFSPAQEDKIVLDTDAITYPLSSTNASVRFLIPAKDLIIGTTGGIFRVVPNQFEYGVSPKTVRVELSDEEGSDKQGIVVNNSIFFPNQAGTQLLEYKYEQGLQQATANDISKFVYPLFNTDSIAQIVHQRTPQPRVWVRTTNNKLFCLSYHRQEDYYAWSKHEMIDTEILDINVLREVGDNNLDGVYITTKRGLQEEVLKYNIERLSGENTSEEAHLDCFVKVVGLNPSTSPSGIPLVTNASIPASNLKAYIVDTTNPSNPVVLELNEAYPPTKVIIGGESDSVFLPTAALPAGYNISGKTWTVCVGQYFVGELQMMFPTWDGGTKPAYGAEEIRVVSTKAYFIDSYRYQIGIKDKFSEIKLGTTAYTGFDKDRPVLNSKFGADNVPEIKHDKPYSLTIASIVVKTDIGSK